MNCETCYHKNDCPRDCCCGLPEPEPVAFAELQKQVEDKIDEYKEACSKMDIPGWRFNHQTGMWWAKCVVVPISKDEP